MHTSLILPRLPHVQDTEKPTPEIEVRPADHQQASALCKHCAVTSNSSLVPTITSHPTNTRAVVKLRQGSGKDWQGMALKAKGLKA